MAHNDFTEDNLKDIVARALSTILSWASEKGTRSGSDEQPCGSRQVAEEEEEVPPLPPPLQTETRRKYSTYMIGDISNISNIYTIGMLATFISCGIYVSFFTEVCHRLL